MKPKAEWILIVLLALFCLSGDTSGIERVQCKKGCQSYACNKKNCGSACT